jgi:hypothetical protein
MRVGCDMALADALLGNELASLETISFFVCDVLF